MQSDQQPVPDGSVCLVALQPQTTHGYCDDTDAAGRFQITNIEPGEYSLSWDDDLTNSYSQGKLVTINQGSQLEEVLVISKATPEGTVALRKEIGIGGRALAFNHDDKLLAIGGRSGVQVWSTESWSQLWEGDPDAELGEVTFSPDGKRLATVGGFSATTAHVWEAMSGKLIAQLSHPDWQGGVLSLDFSADGQLLTVGGNKKILIANATATHQREGEVGYSVLLRRKTGGTSSLQTVSTESRQQVNGKPSYAPIGVSPDGFPTWSKALEPRNLVSELFTQGSVGGRQVTAASTRPTDCLQPTILRPFRFRQQLKPDVRPSEIHSEISCIITLTSKI